MKKSGAKRYDTDKNANGVYEFDGYALHWLQFRKQTIFDVYNSPDYLPILHWAMDDLYYKAMNVSYTYNRPYLNKSFRTGKNIDSGQQFHGNLMQPRPWHGYHG